MSLFLVSADLFSQSPPLPPPPSGYIRIVSDGLHDSTAVVGLLDVWQDSLLTTWGMASQTKRVQPSVSSAATVDTACRVEIFWLSFINPSLKPNYYGNNHLNITTYRPAASLPAVALRYDLFTGSPRFLGTINASSTYVDSYISSQLNAAFVAYLASDRTYFSQYYFNYAITIVPTVGTSAPVGHCHWVNLQVYLNITGIWLAGDPF